MSLGKEEIENAFEDVKSACGDAKQSIQEWSNAWKVCLFFF